MKTIYGSSDFISPGLVIDDDGDYIYMTRSDYKLLAGLLRQTSESKRISGLSLQGNHAKVLLDLEYSHTGF